MRTQGQDPKSELLAELSGQVETVLKATAPAVSHRLGPTGLANAVAGSPTHSSDHVAAEAVAGSPRHPYDQVAADTVAASPTHPCDEAIAEAVAAEWFDEALQGAKAGPWSDLAAALAAVRDDLPWQRAYQELAGSAELDSFRNNYVFAVIVGPVFRGRPPLLLNSHILFCVTLQAPNVHYPNHHHEPEEIYGVIAGAPAWQVGGRSWRSTRPGDVVVHRPNETHAMSTGTEPALCWVAWSSCPADVKVYMPEFDPDPSSGSTLIDYGDGEFG